LNYTWRSLNSALATMSEQQVKELLDQELKGARRIMMLQRLHQRYNTLRVARERKALFAGEVVL
jgi:hypothetical protein